VDFLILLYISLGTFLELIPAEGLTPDPLLPPPTVLTVPPLLPLASDEGPDLIPVVSMVSIAPISLIDRNAWPGAEKYPDLNCFNYFIFEYKYSESRNMSSLWAEPKEKQKPNASNRR